MGGVTTAFVLWSLSGLSEPIPESVRWALVGTGLTALALRARDLVSFPLPQAARQIPREVFDKRPAAAAARFGFALGTGVRTYLISALPYAPAMGILLLRPPLLGTVTIGVGFGMTRGLVPIAYAVRSGGRSVEQ